MIQQFHFWEYVQREQKHQLKKLSVPPCSLQHYYNVIIVITKTWKNLSVCLWMNEYEIWMNENMEYYSAIKMKEILPFATT